MKEVNHRVAAGHGQTLPTDIRTSQEPWEWQCPHAQTQRGLGRVWLCPLGRAERPGMGTGISHTHTVP